MVKDGDAFPPSLPRIIEESTVLATDVLCFCFPLETYHIRPSSITAHYDALWHLNDRDEQSADTKFFKSAFISSGKTMLCCVYLAIVFRQLGFILELHATFITFMFSTEKVELHLILLYRDQWFLLITYFKLWSAN
jgi:hypothetical protein